MRPPPNSMGPGMPGMNMLVDRRKKVLKCLWIVLLVKSLMFSFYSAIFVVLLWVFMRTVEMWKELCQTWTSNLVSKIKSTFTKDRLVKHCSICFGSLLQILFMFLPFCTHLCSDLSIMYVRKEHCYHQQVVKILPLFGILHKAKITGLLTTWKITKMYHVVTLKLPRIQDYMCVLDCNHAL